MASMEEGLQNENVFDEPYEIDEVFKQTEWGSNMFDRSCILTVMFENKICSLILVKFGPILAWKIEPEG